MITITSIMAFALSATGYPPPEQMPRLETMEPAALYAVVADGREMPEGIRVGAAYRDGVVLAPTDFDLDRILHASHLAHELTHHLQHEAGLIMSSNPCTSSIEREAYEVQFAFLRAHGVDDPMAFMGLDPLRHLLLTRCL